MVAKCLKKILLLLFITGAIQANAQKGKKSELQQWKDFIENARLIARQERHLMDSIVHIKAENALQRKEFVLESDELTLKHGEHGYVNSTTNFIALHDGKPSRSAISCIVSSVDWSSTLISRMAKSSMIFLAESPVTLRQMPVRYLVEIQSSLA